MRFGPKPKRTWQSRMNEPDRPHQCRKSKFCSECGSLPHRVKGARCEKCRLRYVPEPSARHEVLLWAAKASIWDRSF